MNKDDLIKKIKLNIALENFKDDLKEENTLEEKKHWMSWHIKKKVVTTICICLIVITGGVFAKDVKNYVKNLFNNSNEAIDSAVENGYLQEEDTDYIYDKGIGIKVEKIVLDDLNLDISFGFEIKKENIKSIRLNDFVIKNDNEKVIYTSEFKTAETLDELPLYNSVTWINEPVKKSNTTFADSILFGLRLEKESFKELYFDVKSVKLIYLDDTKEIINGNWKFEVIISDEMRQSSSVTYTLDEENEFVETCTVTISNTGTVGKLIPKVPIPIDYEFMGAPMRIFLVTSPNYNAYRVDFADYNEWIMDFKIDKLGKYTEDIDYLELYIGFWDTYLFLTKEKSQ